MRHKEPGAGPYVGGLIEIKLRLAAILIVGFLLIVAESVLRYNSRTCSVKWSENSITIQVERRGAMQGLDSTPSPLDVITKKAEGTQTMSPSANESAEIQSKAVPPSVAAEGTQTMSPSANESAEIQSKAVPPSVAATKEAEKFEVKRRFRAYGSAASLFVEFGTYRGGSDSFAIVGLASKPIHVFGNPGFECEWVPASSNLTVKGKAEKMLPDWGYGRVYTVVVVNCSFGEAVGTDGKGGELILYASRGDGLDKPDERIVALTEKEGDYKASLYEPPYPYDFVYCGSSLYGPLNPQRIREWMAYHVKLFGPRSHFVFHDAGGVSPGVRKVLEPWKKLGYVTVQDIKQQEEYDGYYYNQFLIVNDCLHRTRFLANNWTFFFDVDEYLYVLPQETLHSVMQGFSNYTQIVYQQSPMSNKLCLEQQAAASIKKRKINYSRQWGFEKLIYRNIKTGIGWDCKFAIQPRNAFATGVHRSENMVGETLYPWNKIIKYYHYHNTITEKGELCKEFVNSTYTGGVIYSDKEPFTMDTGLEDFADAVKKFEFQQIGPLCKLCL